MGRLNNQSYETYRHDALLCQLVQSRLADFAIKPVRGSQENLAIVIQHIEQCADCRLYDNTMAYMTKAFRMLTDVKPSSNLKKSPVRENPTKDC